MLDLSPQAVGDYLGLSWGDFELADIGTAIIGVTAKSSPNVAYFQPSTGSSFATLSTYGTISSFGLKSFYVGCVASTENNDASVPTGCDVNVIGSRDGQAVVQQTVAFRPTGLLSSGLMQVLLTAAQWAEVDQVTFQSSGLLGSLDIAATVFDNFEYVTSCGPPN